MTTPEPSFSVNVDVANPGQFFACCGLLELAHRLWRGAEGWFDYGLFNVYVYHDGASLIKLLSKFRTCDLCGHTAPADRADPSEEDDSDKDKKASSLGLGDPFSLCLDWWTDKALKPWAGTMDARLIFEAMKAAVNDASDDPLNDAQVVRDPLLSTGLSDDTPGSANAATVHRPRTLRKAKLKKREPFYFDARRGANAKALDIGFMPDALKIPSAAFPAVESLCLVGLQRFRPMPTDIPRVFVYSTWSVPLPPLLAAAAACGLVPGVGGVRYRFENAFRTDQRKHKGFLPATRIGEAQ